MLKVDWHEDEDWFLCTSFEWSNDNQGYLSVHIYQLEFSEHTSELFVLGNSN